MQSSIIIGGKGLARTIWKNISAMFEIADIGVNLIGTNFDQVIHSLLLQYVRL
jgi:hypothetical protein